MRNAFAEELTSLAREDQRIVLLSGDIGNRLFDPFKLMDKERFYNCGVAEANMIGVAAGLALSGLRPVTYTITPFTTTRCFEQIRVDVCYHHAPVVIVGTGSGLSYAELGPTHHSLEDMAIFRTLPGMRILAPCDSAELRAALRAAFQENHPVYIRIGKKGEPDIYKQPPSLKIGKANILREGHDVALLGAGTIMAEVVKAADILNAQDISAEVVSFHTIKPLDTEFLRSAALRFKLLVVVEEHGLIGGLGSAIAEWRADQNILCPQLNYGTPDEFMHEVGSQEYARKKYGLTGENIAKNIISTLYIFAPRLLAGRH
jgi:transketolase